MSPEWRCPSCNWTPATHGQWPVFAPDIAESNDGFAVEFFSTLFDAEADHFWFKARSRLLAWAIRMHVLNARTLLEIGCGTGCVLTGLRETFPALTCAGSEAFIGGLEFAARRLSGVNLYQMDARRIPFDSEFDIVGAFDVIEHIEEDEIVLREMYQAVVPGGSVMITVPQHDWLWSDADELSRHKRRYSRTELTGKLKRAGFTNIRTWSFVSLLLPLMWLHRHLPAKGAPDPSGRSELQIGRWMNTACGRVMDIERALITRGMSLPWGGSLLAIADRPIITSFHPQPAGTSPPGDP